MNYSVDYEPYISAFIAHAILVAFMSHQEMFFLCQIKKVGKSISYLEDLYYVIMIVGVYMARPKKGSNAVPTEERILKAAEAQFGRLGFEKTRLEDIATDAGIRRPSLLYHFKSKDILYSKVVHRAFDSLRVALLDRMRPGDFSIQVENLTCAFSDYVQKNPAFAPIVLREIIDGNGPARTILVNEMAPLLSVVETWLKQQGKNIIPEGISVRYAILQIATNTLLHSASGSLQTVLWGEGDSSRVIARQIFLGSP